MQGLTGQIFRSTKHEWVPRPTTEQAYGLTWRYHDCKNCGLSVVTQDNSTPENERLGTCQQPMKKRSSLF